MEISTSLIRHSFNQAASTYDKTAGVQNWSARKTAQELPSLQEGRILDLGCGTGSLIPYLKVMQPSFYLGLDLSEKMLLLASKKTEGTPHFHYLCHDITRFVQFNLPPFDLIVSNATMQWLPITPDFLQNVRRILSCQGDFIFTYFPPSSYQRLKNALHLMENEKIPFVSDTFLPVELLTRRLRRYFILIKQEEWSYSVRYKNMRELLKSIKRTGVSPTSSPHLHLTRQKLQKLEQIYLQEYGELMIPYRIHFFHYKPRLSLRKT